MKFKFHYRLLETLQALNNTEMSTEFQLETRRNTTTWRPRRRWG